MPSKDYTNANFAESGREPDSFMWEKFTAAQTIGNDASTDVITWESAPTGIGPTSAGFNPTTGVFTAPESGVYIIQGHIQFAANATGYREITGVGLVGRQRVGNAGAAAITLLSVTCAGLLKAGATHKFAVRQNSTGNLDLVYAAISVVRV